MEQCGQGVRLPAPERDQQLEYAVALGAGQPSQHVSEQGLQAAGEVGRPEEAVRVAVDGWNPRQLRSRRTTKKMLSESAAAPSALTRPRDSVCTGHASVTVSPASTKALYFKHENEGMLEGRRG